MQIRQKIKIKAISIISILLSFLFAFQVINKSLFTHTHILADGNVISHAHPFNKTNDPKPFKSHHHRQSEILFMIQLGILFPLVFILMAFYKLIRKVKYYILPDAKFILTYLGFQKGRAPPVLL